MRARRSTKALIPACRSTSRESCAAENPVALTMYRARSPVALAQTVVVERPQSPPHEVVRGLPILQFVVDRLRSRHESLHLLDRAKGLQNKLNF